MNVKEEIAAGLKEAIAKGESLDRAMMSFYNSGYPKQEIEDAALLLRAPQQPQIPPFPKANQPQQPLFKQPTQTQQPQIPPFPKTNQLQQPQQSAFSQPTQIQEPKTEVVEGIDKEEEKVTTVVNTKK